jgi:hypothetical protein
MLLLYQMLRRIHKARELDRWKFPKKKICGNILSRDSPLFSQNFWFLDIIFIAELYVPAVTSLHSGIKFNFNIDIVVMGAGIGKIISRNDKCLSRRRNHVENEWDSSAAFTSEMLL